VLLRLPLVNGELDGADMIWISEEQSISVKMLILVGRTKWG